MSFDVWMYVVYTKCIYIYFLIIHVNVEIIPPKKKSEIYFIFFTLGGLSENPSIRHNPTGCEQTTFTHHLHSKSKKT